MAPKQKDIVNLYSNKSSLFIKHSQWKKKLKTCQEQPDFVCDCFKKMFNKTTTCPKQPLLRGLKSGSLIKKKNLKLCILIQKEVHGDAPNFLFFTKPVLNVILKSECVKSWKFWHSLGKDLTVMTILPLKIIVYSAITCLILKISQFSSPTKITLKLPEWRVFKSIEITLLWIRISNLYL